MTTWPRKEWNPCVRILSKGIKNNLTNHQSFRIWNTEKNIIKAVDLHSVEQGLFRKQWLVLPTSSPVPEVENMLRELCHEVRWREKTQTSVFVHLSRQIESSVTKCATNPRVAVARTLIYPDQRWTWWQVLTAMQ